METQTKHERMGLVYPSDFLGKVANSLGEFFNEVDLPDFKSAFKTFSYPEKTPSANIFKINNGISLEMVIPGYDKKDIDISLEKNILTISGQKEEEKKEFTRMEFSYNSFSRSFNLSDKLNTETIKTSLNNGILTVEITKLQLKEVKSDKINIPVG